MSNRPDADFDVVYVDPEHLDRAPPAEWGRDGGRGIVWSTDDDTGWELVGTNMVQPDAR